MAIRRHMPVDIKNYSETMLTTEPTPNGKTLPKAIAKKFKRCDVLQILRMDPTAISRSHPGSLDSFRVNGMTLTERRAVYSHLTESKTNGDMTIAETWAKNRKDKMVDRKFTWYTTLRDNLKSVLTTYESHVQQCGPPGSHECDLIGNQCPVRADRNVINYYEEDYGYPEGDVYQKLEKPATVFRGSQLSVLKLRNQKRLAYEDWKKAYEKEFKSYTEKRAHKEMKFEGIQKKIDDCEADEIEYSEEHNSLKLELAALPRGSQDRMPMLKKVNFSQTQHNNAKKRKAAAMEELEKSRAKLENEKEFVCSVAKPDWDENGCDTDSNTDVSPMASPPLSVNRVGKSDVDSSRRHSISVIPGQVAGRVGLLAGIQGRDLSGGRGPGSPRGSSRGGSIGAIHNSGSLKPVEEDAAKKTQPPSNVSKNSSSSEKSSVESAKDVQEGHGSNANDSERKDSETVQDAPKDVDVNNDSVKDRGESSMESAKDADTYARKSSNDYAIAATLAPSSESQSYKRKGSGGQGVNKTTLVSCPPPTENILHAVKSNDEEAAKEERLKKAAMEKEHARLQKEEEALRIEEARMRGEAERKERERQEMLAKQREEEERKEKARMREEAERKERERQEMLAKHREEEERKEKDRRLAEETEKKRLLEEENRKKEELGIQQDQIAEELEQRIKEYEEEIAQHQETMQRCKKELKELARGSVEKVAKLKEINHSQQKRGVARKAAEAAKEELDEYLRSK